MEKEFTWYRWTSGPRATYRSEADAEKAWDRFSAKCQQQGHSASNVTCGCARLYACRTRKLARTIDVSEIRTGERIVVHHG